MGYGICRCTCKSNIGTIVSSMPNNHVHLVAWPWRPVNIWNGSFTIPAAVSLQRIERKLNKIDHGDIHPSMGWHTHTHSNHRCLKLFDFLVNYLHWSKRNNCANWCSSTSWLKNVPKTTPSTFYDRGCAGCAMPWRSKLARLQARMFKTLPPKHVLKQTFFEGAEWLGETVSWTNCAKTGQDASKHIFQ